MPDAWQVDYLSAVGTDALSGQMLAFMLASGVGVSHGTRREGLSVGLYLISLENGERSFSYWRDSSAARRLADDPGALARGVSAAELVVFSGITLAILTDAGAWAGGVSAAGADLAAQVIASQGALIVPKAVARG